MTTPITTFIRQMVPGTPGPSEDLFADMWGDLRGMLAGEMKRRSNWSSPPSYLGVVGHSFWADRDERTDALEELASRCFEFVFIRRLDSLRAQAEEKESVDGLVTLSIRHFLLDQQRRSDPLGFRVYELLRRVVGEAVDQGGLVILAGDGRLRNDTVLGLSSAVSEEQARAVDPTPLADRWASAHLDELVTASHASLTALVRTLAADLTTWLGEGAPGFTFGSLVAPLKDRVRDAWGNRFLGSAFTDERPFGRGADAYTREQDALRRFAMISSCVRESVGKLDERKKTLRYLQRLWSFLESFATERDDLPDLGTLGEDELPSHRQLSKLLGLPRERVPELLTTLGGLLQTCRERADLSDEETRPMASPPPAQNPRDRARAAARAALAKAGGRSTGTGGGTLQTGDVVSLPEVEVPGIHWLLLADDGKGKLRCGPVDTCPLLGPGDVPLPERETRSPWVLRSGFEVAVERARLAGARLVDHLDPEVLQATLKAQELEGRQAVDGDLPAYREWIDEGPRRAKAKLQAWSGQAGTLAFRRPTRSSGRWLQAIAAGLVMAVLGLAVQVVRLEKAVDELSRPILDLPAVTLTFDATPRGPETLEIPPDAQRVDIGLVLNVDPDYPAYRIEILGADLQPIHRTEDLPYSSFYSLNFLVREVDEPRLTFRLYGVKDGESTLLEEEEADVVRKARP